MSTDTQVAGGHKASINNPNTSEKSKQHSKVSRIPAGKSEGDKNPNNVAGGLKATINNPNSSEEAKQSAKERLEGMYEANAGT
ncbi:conidiation protein 6 [Macroventuria anomochaeta]|uniref:Conidiation protein 6 n=1 Tax=Macroventuria anomochaeta TaxID=301207 RepID=A0ACB6RIK4_9PLEO|nr:conidiation protein 6 [Macroventuria anomochaeta]KAF2621721.1 conidiation protein 6 [Macroventuria anomochaeta]